MIAFDTDVLTGILLGNAALVERASRLPAVPHCVPVVVVEEVLRGRLSAIRRAESARRGVGIEDAHERFAEAVETLRLARILHYDSQAHGLFTEWRKQGSRISTHDLRIAAICVAHSAKLVSRNRKDFRGVPGLDVEFWD